jgi:hypothetical protein
MEAIRSSETLVTTHKTHDVLTQNDMIELQLRKSAKVEPRAYYRQVYNNVTATPMYSVTHTAGLRGGPAGQLPGALKYHWNRPEIWC